MEFYVGITDDSWFRFLSLEQPDELNFWRPSDRSNFRAIGEGAPFLFKLHSPNNYIVGGGFFVKHLFLPLSLAWDTFEFKNGAASYDIFRKTIMKFRVGEGLNPTIGCTLLTQPFFFSQDEWIPVPSNWSKNIVKGKTYNTLEEVGARLWHQVEERLEIQKYNEGELVVDIVEDPLERTYEIKVRIGQGAFRAMVTDAYEWRCAITGERTLPVLEAAHIKPYAKSGPNRTSNGLLLRSDLHILFDKGYISISDDHHVEVSRRIKEEFENGRLYYAIHGNSLHHLPPNNIDQPSPEFLQYHQQQVYKG